MRVKERKTNRDLHRKEILIEEEKERKEETDTKIERAFKKITKEKAQQPEGVEPTTSFS